MAHAVRRRPLIGASALAVALLLAPATAGAQTGSQNAVQNGTQNGTQNAGPGGTPGAKAVYLVQLADGTDPRPLAGMLRAQGQAVPHVYEHALSGLAVEATVAQADALARRPGVTRVEPDGPVTITGTQSPAAWNLDRIDQRAMPLTGTYTYPNAGAGVTVYVVDTGVRTDHVDLAGRISAGYSTIADGNGTNDCNGHGTHVTGSAAGTTYGVAKAATVVPVRVLDCGGSGSWAGVIAGLDWIVADHTASVPAVVNMSLGGGASSTVDSAVNRVIADGIVTVVAAGNNGLNACNYSPARTPNAVTVGATSNTDARPSWSNYGSCVDVFAPGVSIVSAYSSGPTSTASLSGTSMASPHVAGSAAVRWATTPGATASEIQSALINDSSVGYVVSAGTGSPNRLLYSPPGGPAPAATVPAAPANVVGAAVSTGTVQLSYSLVGDGGSPVTDYDVEYSTDATFAAGTGTFYEGSTTTATTTAVTGLVNGTTYYFRVRATNALGDGPWSDASAGVAPIGLPGAPVSPSAARQAANTVRVSFTAPTSPSGIVDYDIEYSTNSAFTPGTGTLYEGGTTTGTTVDVAGLVNGTMYYFRVRATNALGDGPWSAMTNGAKPYTTPSAPTNVTVTAGSKSATVKWTLPYNGGSALTSQTILVYRSGTLLGTANVSGTTTAATVTGLRGGDVLQFAVRAANAAGTGPASTLAGPVTILA